MSIRAKLIGFFTAVMVIMGAAVSVVWYRDSLHMIDRYLQDYAKGILENSYNAISYVLTDTQYILSMIATNDTNVVKSLERKNLSPLEKMEAQRRIESVVDEMYGYKYYISGIGVITNEGEFYKVGPSVALDAILREIKEKEDDFQEGWRTAILSPVVYTDTSTRDKLLPVVRPIENLRGQRLGYALIYLNYSLMESMLSDNLPEGGRFEVTNGAGEVLFSNTKDLGSDFSPSLRLSDVNNQFIYNRYYAAQADWYLYMGIPAGKMLGDLTATFRRTGTLYAVIYALTLLGAIWFCYRLTKRLGTLSAAMERVSGGDLSVTVPALGKDEIGRMGGIFNHMAARINELLVHVKTKENQKREAELDFLQAQINPHFLSNTLNTVVWMANVQGAANISRLTTSLISLLHATMRRGRELIGLSEELAQIESYVEIEQCCYLDNFEAVFDVPPETMKLLVPRFILQPIVENALIHALSELEDRVGEIRITAAIEENNLLLRIHDNGIGMTEEQIARTLETEKARDGKSFSSIGIKNVNDRIRLFFGEGYGLSFESVLGAYTTVTITLPVLPPEQADTEKESLKK